MVEGMELTSQFVRGSENIDRMRKEIGLVIQMIIGLLSDRDVLRFKTGEWYPSAGKKLFSCENHEWFIKVHAHTNRVSVECTLLRSYGSGGSSETYAYHSDRGPLNIRLKDVQRVHEALPFFLESVLKFFPELEKKCQPFLDAADYKF